jgi:hypothetical protein
MGCKKRRTRRLAAVLGALLLASSAWAELKYTAVSATATSQTIGIGFKTLTIVNDGANEVYVRVFVIGEVPAAATTSSPQIKSGEGFTFEAPQGQVLAVSIVCDTAETATVRLFYW